MLSTLVVCLLVLGATAFQPPTSLTKKLVGLAAMKEKKEPCCAPNYFTLSGTATITSLDYKSDLLLEMIHFDGAYDAISEQYSLIFSEDFFNKTERHLRIIEDYKTGEQFLIAKDGAQEVCFVNETKGLFPKECAPDDAVYLGEVSVGDHGLEVESWYYASEDQSTHFTDSVGADKCVPVSSFSREFDLKTGEEIEIVSTDIYNFNLGICNRDKHFKPPKSCDKGLAVTEPTQKMLKFLSRRPRGVFRR